VDHWAANDFIRAFVDVIDVSSIGCAQFTEFGRDLSTCATVQIGSGNQIAVYDDCVLVSGGVCCDERPLLSCCHFDSPFDVFDAELVLIRIGLSPVDRTKAAYHSTRS
jgi:hypothetical protein